MLAALRAPGSLLQVLARPHHFRAPRPAGLRAREGPVLGVEFATRNRELLRAQHLIEKDLEIEAKFELATEFLFQTKLGHTPLKQPGTDHPDGLLSLKSDYLMWDNKSKDPPGLFHLKDCIGQFGTSTETSC